VVVRRIIAVLLCAALAACTSDQAPPVAAPVDREALQAEATPQPADLVDLLIYYRHGRGADAHLEPVKRAVPVTNDLPRTAMLLLLQGPAKKDPRVLHAPLPRSTKLVGLNVRKGTAVLTLSREAITHARRVGKRPEHEAMALAAVANTLTEFPAIRQVRLRIQGVPARRMWGGWGRPRLLVRDDSAVEPDSLGAVVPPLDSFSHRPQHVGVKQRRRSPRVAAVRIESRATYLRVALEVTAAGGGNLRGPVPPSLARHIVHAKRGGRGKGMAKGPARSHSRRTISLIVRAQPRRSLARALRTKVSDPLVSRATVSVRGRPRRVVVRIRPTRRTQFWLHTLSKPARVVLDIRR